MFEVNLCNGRVICWSLGTDTSPQLLHERMVKVEYLLDVAEQHLDFLFRERVVIATLLLGLFQDVLKKGFKKRKIKEKSNHGYGVKKKWNLSFRLLVYNPASISRELGIQNNN